MCAFETSMRNSKIFFSMAARSRMILRFGFGPRPGQFGDLMASGTEYLASCGTAISKPNRKQCGKILKNICRQVPVRPVKGQDIKKKHFGLQSAKPRPNSKKVPYIIHLMRAKRLRLHEKLIRKKIFRVGAGQVSLKFPVC